MELLLQIGQEFPAPLLPCFLRCRGPDSAVLASLGSELHSAQATVHDELPIGFPDPVFLLTSVGSVLSFFLLAT